MTEIIRIAEWDGFFLRDDTKIRMLSDIKPFEAYSLFSNGTKAPYGRLEVFAGSSGWAIEQAKKKIKEVESNNLMVDNIKKKHHEDTIKASIIQRLKGLTRYNIYSYLYSESVNDTEATEDENGNYVYWEDIEKLIDEILKPNGK